MQIPFNRPYVAGKEFDYIKQAVENYKLCGNGEFTQRCQQWLADMTGAHKVLLTTSCTAALEMSAILIDLEPGDEVIMPSFTFVSTANAFVLRGAVPVFVDIDPQILCIDPNQIEAAITPKTKAIVPVHYAGVICEMDSIREIANRHHLHVICDAAQAITSTYKGRPGGSLGDLSTFSFHETKNLISGEGGALVINDERFAERAEIIWEKGTNRANFLRGQIDKYTWVDVGSSYLPSEMIAAYLFAQLENYQDIMQRRLRSWQFYHDSLLPLEKAGICRCPHIPASVTHNAHLYYLLLENVGARQKFMDHCNKLGIATPFHYVPLHNSPAGKKYARTSGSLFHTERLSERLVRLPLWAGISDEMLKDVVRGVIASLTRHPVRQQ